MADTLAETLRSKKLTLAAAVSCKTLVLELASLLSGVFQYLLNAEPQAVREMVFEVPRTYLHENDGVNRQSAMYAAHNVTGLCNTEAGFALIMQPHATQAFMALSAAGSITWQEFDLPEYMDDAEKTAFVCRRIIHFCGTALENYPDEIADSIPASEFLSEPEEAPDVFRFLRP